MTLNHWSALRHSGVSAARAKFSAPIKQRRGLYTSLWRSGAEKSAGAAEEKLVGIPYSKLSIGVPKESWTGERRVACSPAVTATLAKKGFTLKIEEKAGEQANFRNEDFEAAGAKIVSRDEAFKSGRYPFNYFN